MNYKEYFQLLETTSAIVDQLAKDILLNWIDKDEEELLAFLKDGISDTWMTYLKGLSDQELGDVIDQAYYTAHNN